MDVTLQVDDQRGGVVQQAFTIAIQPDPSNNLPIIISAATTKATVADGYRYDVDGIDPDGDQLTYSLVDAPAAMTIDVNTGVLAWDLTPSDIGTHDVTVRAEDGRGGFDEQSFTIEVVEEITGELAISDIETSGLTYDGQSLHVDGAVTATVTNEGTTNLDGPIDVVFFEDSDLNGLFDETVDNVLGTTTITDPLAAGESVPVAASLFGSVQFVDNVIWGFVDSGNVVVETDESDNYARHECIFVPEPGTFDPVVEWNKKLFHRCPQLEPSDDDAGGGRHEQRRCPRHYLQHVCRRQLSR